MEIKDIMDIDLANQDDTFTQYLEMAQRQSEMKRNDVNNIQTNISIISSPKGI